MVVDVDRDGVHGQQEVAHLQHHEVLEGRAPRVLFDVAQNQPLHSDRVMTLQCPEL